MTAGKRHRTRVGKRNQVTIPAAVLRRMGLRPGDLVEIRDDEDGVSVVKAEDPISRFMGVLWRPDLPVLPDDELEAEIRRASEEGATARYMRSLPPDHPDVRRHERPDKSGHEDASGPGGSG